MPGWGVRFLYSPRCPLVVRPIHSPVQWISTAFSMAVKWLGYETITIQFDAAHPVMCIELHK